MLKEIIISIQAYFEAHRFIVKHRLWKWIVIPGLIYTILFIVGIYFFWTSSNTAIEWVLQQTGVKGWLDRVHESWLNFIFIVGQIILRLVLLMFYFSLFKFLFLIIGSPVFAYLSEKNRKHTRKQGFPFQLFTTDQRCWTCSADSPSEYAVANGLCHQYPYTFIYPGCGLDYTLAGILCRLLLPWFFHARLQQ
jgi:CysZ protein